MSPGLIIGHTQRKFPASGAATSRVIAYLSAVSRNSILALYNNTTCNAELQVFFSKKWPFFQVCTTFHFFSFQGGFHVIFHKSHKTRKTASVCQKTPLIPYACPEKSLPGKLLHYTMCLWTVLWCFSAVRVHMCPCPNKAAQQENSAKFSKKISRHPKRQREMMNFIDRSGYQ